MTLHALAGTRMMQTVRPTLREPPRPFLFGFTLPLTGTAAMAMRHTSIPLASFQFLAKSGTFELAICHKARTVLEPSTLPRWHLKTPVRRTPAYHLVLLASSRHVLQPHYGSLIRSHSFAPRRVGGVW